MDPGRHVAQLVQSINCVDIKDEDAAIIQVIIHSMEHLFPCVKIRNVIERVEHADHNIEARSKMQRSHICFNERGFRASTSGVGKHFGRKVNTRERKARAKSCEYGASSATKFQNRLSLGIVWLDESKNLANTVERLAIDGVIKRRELGVTRHSKVCH